MTSVPESAGTIGLWAGFLDRLPSAEAVACVQELERAGVSTIWLQEFSGVDPFVRASLYLSATSRLTVALGVAVIHARDPEAMVSVASTLEEAFPGRFVLGLGVSHGALVERRGHEYKAPLATMREYLGAMEATRRGRPMPPRILGALGPRMVELAGAAADGLHTYFSPVAHTAAARESIGAGRWLAPTQMVALGGQGGGWSDELRTYLGFCLGMPNYTRNLGRFGFTETDMAEVSDRLVDALVVADRPEALRRRIDEQHSAGADQVVLQFVPPPPAAVVAERVAGGFPAPGG